MTTLKEKRILLENEVNANEYYNTNEYDEYDAIDIFGYYENDVKKVVIEFEKFLIDYQKWLIDKMTISELNNKYLNKYGDPTNPLNVYKKIFGDFK